MEKYLFTEDGRIPNKFYPLLIYRQVFDKRNDEGARLAEKQIRGKRLVELMAGAAFIHFIIITANCSGNPHSSSRLFKNCAAYGTDSPTCGYHV